MSVYVCERSMQPRQLEFPMKYKNLMKVGVSVLAAMALSCGGCATRPSAADQAKVDADIDALSKALLAYRGDLGNFPASDQGLDALVHADGSGHWKGPYIQKVPRTPWGDDYHYDRKTDLFTKGRSSSTTTNTGYIICVQNSHERLYCVPKNQFDGTVEFDSYLIYGRSFGMQSSDRDWRWWDLR